MAADKKKKKPSAKPAKAAKTVAKPAAKPAAKAPAKKAPAPAIGKLKIPTKLPGFLPKTANLAKSVSTASGAAPSRLNILLDKHDITEVLMNYCRAVDRGDENLLRSIYHPDATDDRGPGLFQGSAQDFVAWMMGVLAGIKLSHTQLSNIRIDLRRDVALVESYYFAHHRLDKPTGKEDLFTGGRFLDRFERRPGGPGGVWKIAHRKDVHDWARTVPAADIFYIQNPDALWGTRGRGDLSYQMENFPAAGQNRTQAFIGKAYNVKSAKF